MMHWGGWAGTGHGWFGFGWIFTLIFWVVLILGVIYFARQLWGCNEDGSGPHDSAEDVLKKRFAAGEITREEFDEKRSVIKSS